MGVRGLQSYIEQYCPKALRKIKIDGLVRDYKKLHPDKEVVIVVDLNSWYFGWFTGQVVGALLGDNIYEIIYQIKRFIKAFKKIGVKLVFFMDGTIPDYKLETWIERRRNDLQKLIDVFRHLRTDFINLVERHYKLIGKNSLLIGTLLKNNLQCEVFSSTRECDDEIMEYIHQYDCCAVICKDTDFIISDIEASVILASTLDIRKMTAYVYDKIELTHKLQIEVNELPLFATLVGNDIVPLDHLRNFHQQITRNANKASYFEAVGKYISDHLRPEEKENASSMSSVLDKIAKRVYGDKSGLSKLEIIRKSYESYRFTTSAVIEEPNDENDKWLAILKVAKSRHRYLQNPNVIWQVLSNRTVYFGVNYEDYSTCHYQNKDPSCVLSYTVTRLLRKRLYEILLHEYPTQCVTVMVGEYCAENINSYTNPYCVECVKIKRWKSHPGLLNLWTNPCDECCTQNKWELFLYSISPKIQDRNIWQKLKPNILLATASLYYLYETRYLKRWEVLAFIGAIATFPRYCRQKIANLPTIYNIRSISVYATFTVTFSTVYALFAACGYPNPAATELNCHNLEGKLFHIKYQLAVGRVQHKRWNVDDIMYLLCEDNISKNIFVQMKNIIFERD